MPAVGEATRLSSVYGGQKTGGLLLLTLSELELTAKLMLNCSPLTSSVFACTQTNKRIHKYLNLSYPLIFLNNNFLSPDHLCGLLFSFQSYILHPEACITLQLLTALYVKSKTASAEEGFQDVLKKQDMQTRA